MSTPAAPFAPATLHALHEGAIVVDRPDLGLLAFAGADAAAFLHGQLSSDVKGLAPDHGHWTTYNSPKGRMLATMFLYRPAAGPADRYHALLSADIAEPVRKRLAMYVLRSKVAVTDDSATTVRLGVGGPRAADAVAALGAVPPPGHATAFEGGEIVGWPDGRFVVVAGAAAADAVREHLAAVATPAPAPAWAWLGIRAGVPMVTAATQEQFVPQTANWDALGGLDFQKGCYPGQEIVARTQYLGRLKERLFVMGTDAPPPPPGTRLYASVFGDQPCGTVVNSSPDPGGGSVLLAVLQVEAAGDVRLGAPDGPALRSHPLPYALPAPVEPRGRVKL